MYCVMCCYTYSTKGSLQQTNVKILLLLFRNPTDAAHQLQQATKVDALCRAANVYSILPDSGWKRASVWIMLIHNISAFTLHTNPLLYMWERLIRTHHHPWYIRLPSRIPVCKPLLFSSPPPCVSIFCFVLAFRVPFICMAASAFSTQTGLLVMHALYHLEIGLYRCATCACWMECVWHCLHRQPHNMHVHWSVRDFEHVVTRTHTPNGWQLCAHDIDRVTLCLYSCLLIQTVETFSLSWLSNVCCDLQWLWSGCCLSHCPSMGLSTACSMFWPLALRLSSCLVLPSTGITAPRNAVTIALSKSHGKTHYCWAAAACSHLRGPLLFRMQKCRLVSTERPVS